MRLVMALFPKFVHNKLLVARSGGNVPAWLVFIFQATSERLFPRSSYSPGKRPDRDMKLGEKLLFQAGDTLPDCCFRQSNFFRDLYTGVVL